MKKARIYKPSRTAMQSGRAKSAEWVLELLPQAGSRSKDPLMGWTSTSDTSSQVKLHFDTREEAIRYAETAKMAFEVVDSRPAKRLVKSYSANFDVSRKQPWTH